MKHTVRNCLVFLLLLQLACVPLLLLKSNASAEGGNAPASVMLDALVDQYEPVNFNHEMHTYIADSCGKCHHVHDPERTRACNSCHALDADAFRGAVQNSFMACRTCHSGYDPDNPGMPALKVAYHKQCFGCHVGIAELGESPKSCAQMCHARRQ